MLESGSKVDVAGVGMNATDTLILVPHFPAFDSKIQFISAETKAGGQIATAIVACRRWGLRTRYIGSVGDDPAARLQTEEFARERVDAKLFRTPNCTSQISFILVDQQTGERTIIWKRDPRLEMKPELIQKEWITSARALLVDGHDTAASAAAARIARAAHIPVVADVDNLYPGVEALLENVDYLLSSKEFPLRFTGESNLLDALIAVHKRFECRLTGATIGRLGVIAWDGNNFLMCPGFCVDAVDTTGAGDVFHAAFIYALLEAEPLETMLEFSCAAAALSCTAIGARGRIASLAEIRALMQQGRRSESPYSDDELQHYRLRA